MIARQAYSALAEIFIVTRKLIGNPGRPIVLPGRFFAIKDSRVRG
jgi:hypothetical protein